MAALNLKSSPTGGTINKLSDEFPINDETLGLSEKIEKGTVEGSLIDRSIRKFLVSWIEIHDD